MCPNNPIGTVDLYLVTHHGLDQSGSPVLVHGAAAARRGHAERHAQRRRHAGDADHADVAGARRHLAAALVVRSGHRAEQRRRVHRQRRRQRHDRRHPDGRRPGRAGPVVVGPAPAAGAAASPTPGAAPQAQRATTGRRTWRRSGGAFACVLDQDFCPAGRDRSRSPTAATGSRRRTPHARGHGSAAVTGDGSGGAKSLVQLRSHHESFDSACSLLAVAAASLVTTVLAQQPPARWRARSRRARRRRGRAADAVRRPVPDVPPMQVFIYGGLKTHAEGQHDYPQFLADWSKILHEPQRDRRRRPALPVGTRARQASTSLVIYKGDAGYLSMEDRANLDAYLRRGGGLVSMHDALCGRRHRVLREHRRRRQEARRDELHARSQRALHDRRHGASDHAGHGRTSRSRTRRSSSMTWSKTPEIHVLATAVIDGDAERRDRTRARSCRRSGRTRSRSRPAPTGSPYRAFVWMQGHNYSNFALPKVQPMLLRGIAWAGKRPSDTLMTERPQRRRGSAPPADGTGRGRGGTSEFGSRDPRQSLPRAGCRSESGASAARRRVAAGWGPRL